MKQTLDLNPTYDFTSLAPSSFVEELLKRLLESMATWKQRSKSRVRLAELSSHQLKDLGLDQQQAFVESSKHFWEK